jgi:hypothetical protein
LAALVRKMHDAREAGVNGVDTMRGGRNLGTYISQAQQIRALDRWQDDSAIVDLPESNDLVHG